MQLCIPQNWITKIEQMQKLLDSWRTRNLTLQGRILIIKTLAISKLVYSSSLLPLPDGIVKSVNKLLFKFLWGNSGEML